MKTYITRSETWLGDDFKIIERVFESAIESYVGSDEEIINVQMVTGENGLSRFWIYTRTK